MRVYVYPEKAYEELGAVRWEVEWQELTPAAKKRHENPDYEHDHDIDEVSCYRVFKTQAAAEKFARNVVDKYQTVYGCATVHKQTVKWYVEEDRIAEWADVGEPSYVD